MEDRYYSTGQAATELGVSQARVRALCQSSAIETEITPGGQWRISKSERDRLKAEGLPAIPRPLPGADRRPSSSNGSNGHPALYAEPSEKVVDAAEQLVVLQHEVQALELRKQREQQLDWFRGREAEAQAEQDAREREERVRLAEERADQRLRYGRRTEEGRYVYYHCTGYKGKCPEKYVREEILEERFGDLLKTIRLPEDVMSWVARAPRESHSDEKRFREAEISKLQAEHKWIQNRIDTMYTDRLDGRIGPEFFDRAAPVLREDQSRILGEIQAYQTANQSYIEEGVKLLDLAGRAHALFESQPASEKRKLLDFVLSNCAWKEGTLTAQYRQPF